jgi:arylsulfatase A-like enzyme
MKQQRRKISRILKTQNNKMMKKIIALLVIMSSILMVTTIRAETAINNKSKQNVIFILIDDMGWMDCSVYGSQYYETPEIDRLASMGVRFTQAYSANPLCSPTRAAILTGRYPSRFDLTSAAGHLPANPDEKFGIRENAPDWQKVRTPNIRTYMPLEEQTIAEVLKEEGYVTVHIGKWHVGDEDYYPEKQGFDYNIGGYNLGWPRSYFSPYNNEKLPDGPDGEHITDRLTDEAINFIRTNNDTSFYMNLWYFSVHGPFHAKKELVEKYEKKNDPRGRQGYPIMGAMIESLDQNIGRLIDELEELKLLDNTILVFTSDNGGVEYISDHGMPVTNNYPLRYGKGNVHEGGIRVPCIVYWPGKTQKGAVSDQTISSVDFFPTILEMLGMKEKETSNEIDGISITQALQGGEIPPRDGIFIDFPHYTIAPGNYPSNILINDRWKFFRVYGVGENKGHYYKLYDIRNDLREEFNQAANYPKLVKNYDRMITKHLKKIGSSHPLPNPNYNSEAESPLGKELNQAKTLIK